jgi:hypothetical protein
VAAKKVTISSVAEMQFRCIVVFWLFFVLVLLLSEAVLMLDRRRDCIIPSRERGIGFLSARYTNDPVLRAAASDFQSQICAARASVLNGLLAVLGLRFLNYNAKQNRIVFL